MSTAILDNEVLLGILFNGTIEINISIVRWPKWLTFHFHTTSQFRIPNSEFQIPNSEIRNAKFGTRDCEVYVVWASGNS